jgi:1-phosphatidylinositol-4-phosphate 5-kinase
MFFCGGGEYIVKTIRAREAAVLHSFLPVYASYIKRHPDSLLCRFLGSYSLEVYSQTFYFVVMLNCFDPTAYINERFDIKGSWVGRSAEPGKKTKRQVCRHCNEYFVPAKQTQCKAVVGNHEANVVLKDNDLRTKISLPPDEAANVLKILKRDSELLGKLGVIDYSLLIGVKKWKFGVEITQEMVDFDPSAAPGKQSLTPKGPKSTFHAHTVTGPAVYHFGIIDFLQNWTFQKRVERAFKIYVTRKDPDGLSVMPPVPYKTRFQAKLEQIFDVEGTIGGIGGMSAARVPPPKPPHRNRIPNNTENGADNPIVIEMTSMQPDEKIEDAFDFDPMVTIPKLDLQHSLDLGRTKNNDFDDFEDV